MTYTYLGTRLRKGRKEAVMAIDGLAGGKLTPQVKVTGRVQGAAALDMAVGQICLAEVKAQVVLVHETKGKLTASLDSKLERICGDEVLSQKGALTAKDARDNRNCHYRVYPLQMEAGRTYIISLECMSSGLFDTFVRITDDKGKVMAEDDDGGVLLNSLLEFTPPQTGMYHIVTTSFQPNTVGTFWLIVRRS
jgi:hypothetical protein